jgi:hypothetical protein
MKKISFLVLLSAMVFTASAQFAAHCGTPEMDRRLRESNPEYVANRQAIEDFTQKYIAKNGGSGARGGEIITIPVVVHVVYATDLENISDDQVISQIDVLNEDMRRLNADASETPAEFEGVAADFEIEFCLATVDPDGNPTTGIIRVPTDVESFGFSEDMKFTASGGSDAWPADDYLNMWSCNLGAGLLGFAQFPGGPDATDGVAITYSSFGREGYVLAPYDLGRTGTHEVGHWLNLYHIWGDDSDCSGSDLVDDTPNQEVSTYGCPSGVLADACNASIQYQNYMDYTDDACYNMFTEGQKERARAIFEAGGDRFELANSLACVSYNFDAEAIEIVSPNGNYCYPTFSPIVTIRNAGLETMNSCSIDYSVDGATGITYFWTGSLETYETEDVTLPSISLGDGAHSLCVTVSEPNGNPDENSANDEACSDFFINSFGLTLPLIQGFEPADFPYVGYTIYNPDLSYTWERTTAAAKLGSASIFMNHFENNAVGAVDEIELPAYNMSGIPTAHLDFDVAYANYTPGGEYSDTLEVLVTADCGVTWNSIYYKAWPDLNTVSATGAAFVPEQDEWRFESLSLTPYVGDKLIVKFRTVSSWENNLYLDNINIASGAVGIQEMDNNNWFDVYPNPADNWVNISFRFTEGSELTVDILDMNGRPVYSDVIRNISGQINQTSLPVAGLPSGMYTIRINNDSNIVHKSFLKN